MAKRNASKGKDGGIDVFKSIKSSEVSNNLAIEPSWILIKMNPIIIKPIKPNS